MRGRKPKPTHLKVVTGNPGRRPLNAREPSPAGDLKAPPEWLTDDQKAGWAYAIEHAPRGLLRKLDQSVFTAWVVAESLHREATQMVRRTGLMVRAPNTGLLIQSPYLPVINKQAQIMLKAAEQLGFSPSSRGRISISGDEEEGGAEEFFR